MKLARSARAFPLPENAEPEDVLAHLNLLTDRQPTYAAVLLFAYKPQQFLLPSEVKCAHFHGTQVTIPDKSTSSRQRYRLTAKGQTVLDELK